METLSSIDSAFLDAAEEEIYQMLLYQHLSYSDRWEVSYLSIKVAPLIRIFGLVLSLIGVLMCLYAIWRSPAWCPVWFDIYFYFPIFIVCCFIFYFLPHINKAICKWNRNYAPRNCKKLAGKCVNAARTQVPYRAKYIIEHGLINYYREKDGESNFIWKRKLKGVAFTGDYATLIFRKKTSFMSKIVILHEDSKLITEDLRKESLEVYPMQAYSKS